MLRLQPLQRCPAATAGDGAGAGRADPVLDPAALQKLRDLDPDGRNRVVQRVLEAYDATMQKLLDQLAPADGRVDPERTRHVAHTLKSSSASIGALELSRRCAEVEGRLRAQQFDDLGTLLDAVRSEARRVQGAVRSMLAS